VIRFFKKWFAKRAGLPNKDAPRIFEVTGEYPCGSDPDIPFETLNPLQSCFKDNYRPDKHCVMESGTGTGKTAIAYIASRCFLDEGQKVILTAPTRELVKSLYRESIGIWGAKIVGLNTHSDKTVADKFFVVTTPEGFLSAVRSGKEWTKAGLLIIDEAHNLLDPSRGGNLDVAMTVHVIGGGKVLLISGTFPNKSDLADLLNADMFISKYRKTLIRMNEVHVPDDLNAQPVPKKLPAGVTPTITGHIYNRDSVRLKLLKDILLKHREDNILIFVPTKAVGYCLSESLVAPMHCADIEDKERDRLVAEFNAGKLKTLLATNTLSQGINTPADVVVVCGTRRGGYFLEKTDVDQMFGRAGRGKPEATVYLLGDKIEMFNAKKMSLAKSLPLPVQSMVLTVLSLNPASKQDLRRALSMTYAASLTTAQKVDESIEKNLHFLRSCHILYRKDGGMYSLTKEGILIARYFFSPSDYIGYMKVARKLMAMDFPEIDKGCILLSMIIPFGAMPEFPERIIKDFIMKWESIKMEKEVRYKDGQRTQGNSGEEAAIDRGMNEPEGNGEAEEVRQTNKVESDLAITRIAQRSALLKYFLQRASAIPPYFTYQLKDSERFIGMLNDMEYYKIHTEAPGKKWLQNTVFALKINVVKSTSRKKPLQPSLI
jgi:replicative superfamily II helicase